MKRKLILTAVAASCIIGGAILMGVGYSKGAKLNFRVNYADRKVVTGDSEIINKTFTPKEEGASKYSKITIDSCYCDVSVVSGDAYSVIYKGDENLIPDVQIEDSFILVKQRKKKSDTSLNFGILNFMHNGLNIGFNQPSSSLIITIPSEMTVTFLSIESDYGDLTVEGVTVDSIEATLSYGDIELNDVSGEDAVIKSSYGDFNGSKVDIEDTRINLDFGDVECDLEREYDDCDIHIKTSFGDIEVNGSEYEDDVFKKGGSEIYFDAFTDYGDIALTTR